MPWTSEYRPTQLQDIAGNNNQIKKIKNWADNWNSESEPIILYGSPGLGKTSAAYALANTMDWEVMEMNASDKRTGSIINKIAGQASNTISLTGKKRKLIILDEADNLHGNYDRGGKRAITKVIKNSSQPIILIANNYYDLTRSLRNSTTGIEFKSIDETEIAKALRDICEDKGIKYDIDSLRNIAKNSEGDLRAAINDLQKNAVGKKELKSSDLVLDSRNKKVNIFPFLDYVLKEGETKNAQKESQKLDMTPEEIFRWINENLPREYESEELVNGLGNLTKADIWLSRTRKTQEYKYWKYANDELTAGVSSARAKKHTGWTRWQPPRWNNKKGISKELLEKIASRSCCSIQTTKLEIIPILSEMIPYCKPRELTVLIASWYDMNASELSELTGSGKTTNKVQSIIKDAEEINQNFDIKPEEPIIQLNENDNLDNEESESIDESQEETQDSKKDNEESEKDDQAALDDFI